MYIWKLGNMYIHMYIVSSYGQISFGFLAASGKTNDT